MKNIVDELKAYLKNASSEQLAQDWDDLKEFCDQGPDVQVFIEQLNEMNYIWDVTSDEVNLKDADNPEFSLDFLFLAA